MAIIVISHQMGAGGPELGMALSKRLGYRYVDQELLQDAVRRYGLAEDKLSHLDESKPAFSEPFDTETRHHITVLQTTLLELAELDNCVFMRGGGQWLLRGVPHVMRMRGIAPFEHRVKHLVKRAAAMGATFPQRTPGRAGGRGPPPPGARRGVIAPRALASRVQVALATHPETRRYRITVEAQDGVVTLEGTAALERAVEAAGTVAGG